MFRRDRGGGFIMNLFVPTRVYIVDNPLRIELIIVPEQEGTDNDGQEERYFYFGAHKLSHFYNWNQQ